MLSFLRSLPGWGEISGSLGSTLVLAAREGGERLNHYSLLQLKSFRHLLSFFCVQISNLALLGLSSTDCGH